MFCSNCGAKIVEGGQFCASCGAKVPAAEAGMAGSTSMAGSASMTGSTGMTGIPGSPGMQASGSEQQTASGWAQPQTVYVEKKTESLAVASLVMSVLGILFVLPVIGSILGIVFGKMAQNKIDESGGQLAGEGLANAGIIVGIIGIVLAVLGIIALMLMFGAMFSSLGPSSMPRY